MGIEQEIEMLESDIKTSKKIMRFINPNTVPLYEKWIKEKEIKVIELKEKLEKGK